MTDREQTRRKPGEEELCACGHRYAVHAGHPGTACVRYIKGQRCDCREFQWVKR